MSLSLPKTSLELISTITNGRKYKEGQIQQKSADKLPGTLPTSSLGDVTALSIWLRPRRVMTTQDDLE